MWEKRFSLFETVWPIKFVNPTWNDLYQGCPNTWIYHMHRASPFKSYAWFFKMHQELFSAVLSRKASKQHDYSVRFSKGEGLWTEVNRFMSGFNEEFRPCLRSTTTRKSYMNINIKGSYCNMELYVYSVGSINFLHLLTSIHSSSSSTLMDLALWPVLIQN